MRCSSCRGISPFRWASTAFRTNAFCANAHTSNLIKTGYFSAANRQTAEHTAGGQTPSRMYHSHANIDGSARHVHIVPGQVLRRFFLSCSLTFARLLALILWNANAVSMFEHRSVRNNTEDRCLFIFICLLSHAHIRRRCQCGATTSGSQQKSCSFRATKSSSNSLRAETG